MKKQAQEMTAAALILVGLPCFTERQIVPPIPCDSGVEKRSPIFFKTLIEIAVEQDKSLGRD